MTVTADPTPSRWSILTSDAQRLYSHLLQPNSFGKFDVWVRTDAIDDPLLLAGLCMKPMRRPEEPTTLVGLAHVRLGSSYQPRVSLEPRFAYGELSKKQLEDDWLREHALATSLRRPMRLGMISLVVGKMDLREHRYFRDRGFTHALTLHEVKVHEVLGS